MYLVPLLTILSLSEYFIVLSNFSSLPQRLFLPRFHPPCQTSPPPPVVRVSLTVLSFPRRSRPLGLCYGQFEPQGQVTGSSPFTWFRSRLVCPVLQACFPFPPGPPLASDIHSPMDTPLSFFWFFSFCKSLGTKLVPPSCFFLLPLRRSVVFCRRFLFGSRWPRPPLLVPLVKLTFLAPLGE